MTKHRKPSLTKRILPRVAALLGPLLIRLIHATLRVRRTPRRLEELDRDPRELRGPYIFAFWHQSQLIPAWTHRNRETAILISRHGDGELISRVVQRLGFHPVRGSSTRGGVPALKKLVREVRSGRDVAFTPDGPRGPRCRIHGGVIQAASMSGVPIFPVSFTSWPVKRLRSWDRFMIPVPFSRVLISYDDPIHVPRNLDRDEREAYRLKLERVLRDLSAKAWREVRRD
jgi:lysophospholipid acyltransferase (LPLAT)-like uncharacterized protein